MAHILYIMPLWIVVFVSIIIWYAYGWLFSHKHIQTHMGIRVLISTLFIATAVFILRTTVFARSAGISELHIFPFHFLELAKINPEIYRSMLLNIVMFIPLGMFLSALLPQTLSKRNRVLVSSVTGLFLSIAVETLQFYLKRGESELDDIILNCIGAFIGSLILYHSDISRKLKQSTYYDKELLNFLSITFVFSWTFWGFVSFFTTHSVKNTTKMSIVLYIIGSLAPLIASIILKKKFIFNEFKLLRKHKFKYFLASFFLIILLFVLSSKGFKLSQINSLPINFIKHLIIFAIPYELGWRGISFVRISNKTSFLTACIINGLLFSLWHMPSYYIIGSPLYNIPVYIVILISIGFSVILSALFIKTGNIIPNIITNALIISLMNTFIIKNELLFLGLIYILSIIAIAITQKTERS